MKIWLFKPTKIYHNVMNRLCVIVLLLVLFCDNVSGQRVISGQVTRSRCNEPLTGVVIGARGANRGTLSGLDGNFRLSVEPLYTTLFFSLLGYECQEITIGNDSIFNVALQPVPFVLDEFFTLNALVYSGERFIDGRSNRECQLIKVEKQWGERDLQTFDSTFFLHHININNLEQFVCNPSPIEVIVVRFRLNIEGDIIDASIVRGIHLGHRRLLHYEILTAFQSAPRLNCRVLNDLRSRYFQAFIGVKPCERPIDIILPIRIRITEVHQ